MVRIKLIWLCRIGLLLLTPKPKQMMNINVKVNVKIKKGTFSKKAKKQYFRHILKQNFVMFPGYIYKSFDISTKIIITTI